MFIARGKSKNTAKGFTLVELLVTISIFAILTGVVLFSQARFNSTILLTNLAYDTGLTICQAQTYGINIKNFNSTGLVGGDRFLPYGVHFDTSANRSFILFADIDASLDERKTITDGIYDGDGDGELEYIDLNLCQNDMGCVSRYNIIRDNYILALCSGYNESSCNLKSVDIVFKRPNPDAIITAVNSAGEEQKNLPLVRIKLGGPVSKDVRYVTVQSNGLISIEKE